MFEQLKRIDLEIMSIRHQLSSFQEFVAPSDVKDGYTPEKLKSRLQELNREKKLLLK